MSRLEDIEVSIKKYSKEAIIQKVYNKSLKRDLLFVFVEGSCKKVMIFDQFRGLNEIATIRYSVAGKRVSLSEFRVNEDYQRNGIGRFMFEFALTHGDAVGAEYVVGFANPTDPIKGVSEDCGRDDEMLALIEIYKKLGCRFSNVNDVYGAQFEQRWISGEKVKGADETMRNLVDLVVGYEKEKLDKVK